MANDVNDVNDIDIGSSTDNSTTTISANSVIVDDDLKINDIKNSDDDNQDDISIDLLPVGLIPQYNMKTFITQQDEIEQTSPIHHWSQCDSTSFDVRRGPNYVSGQKSPSKPSIYTPFAMDTYKVPYKINKITQFMNVSSYINKYKYNMNAKYPLPPILIINIMVPDYEPQLTSSFNNKYNGKGYQVIVYAHLSQNVLKLLINNNNNANIYIQPSIKLLTRFILSGNLNTSLRDRFKCMGRVMNLKYTKFNFLTKKLISEYNAKPFLAKCSTIIHHEYGKYLAIDLDAHQFGYVAKKCWNHIKNIMNNVIYDLAFVIEAHPNNELPEQILTSVRISKVSAQKTKLLPQIYINEYQKRQLIINKNISSTYLNNYNNSISDSDKKHINNDHI